MNRRSHLLLVVFTLAMSGILGCTGEDGVRTGVTNGVSAGIAALIQAPVNAFIQDTFAAK